MFVLDFMNDVDTIRMAFEDYPHDDPGGRTDPNNYMTSRLRSMGTRCTINTGRATRRTLPPNAEENSTIPMPARLYITRSRRGCPGGFQGKAKAFTRTYSSRPILPFGTPSGRSSQPSWTSYSCCPPPEEDLSKGILESIDGWIATA